MMNQPLLSYDDVAITSQPLINPHLDDITPEVEAFCRKYHIWLPQFADYHTMTAYLYPRTSREQLAVLNIFMNLLWFIDDKFDDIRMSDHADNQGHSASAIFKVATDVLIEGKFPSDKNIPWLAVCSALRDKVIALNGEAWLETIAQTLNHHLQSITSTIDTVIVNGKPNLERYLAIRQRDSGMLVAIDCIELAYNVTLSDDVRHHPIIQIARDCVGHVGGLMNDLMSYHKDERDNNSFNLIAILRQLHDLNAEEGIHEAVKIINRYIGDFETCERYMPQWDDDDKNRMTQLYMEGLRDQIEASFHWQVATNRYRSPDAYYHRLQA